MRHQQKEKHLDQTVKIQHEKFTGIQVWTLSNIKTLLVMGGGGVCFDCRQKISVRHILRHSYVSKFCLLNGLKGTFLSKIIRDSQIQD